MGYEQDAGVDVSVGNRGGFGVRLVAYLIDAIILAVVQVVLRLVGIDATIIPWIALVIGIVYFTAFWSMRGATPGKMAMGLEVRTPDTGALPSPGRALGRYLCYFISALPLGLGFLWIIWDREKRGWHDIIASTCVVRRR